MSCSRYVGVKDLPPRELAFATEHWRVAHSFNSSLPGWLVVIPDRHVVAVHELSDDEAAELGPLLIRLSRALEKITGCVKTYVLQIAEAEGFAHVHFHVVPRMADFTPEVRGPRVFEFLKKPENEWVPTEEMDSIALAVRAELER